MINSFSIKGILFVFCRCNKSEIVSLQVEVNAFMKEQSVLGIEYLNVVDTAIKTQECAPANPNYAITDQSMPVWAWILIAIGLIALVAILIGIYCFYDKRRTHAPGGINK